MSRATFARVLADHAWSGSRTLPLPDERRERSAVRVVVAVVWVLWIVGAVMP